MLSVIIPVFKAEQSLRKCVDSILEQTYRNLEIVLIDDGSPDGSPEICDEYAKCDSRVKVIHQKNRGVSVARNTGLDHVSGEYITFVDSDDYIESDMYESMMKIVEQYNCDVVMCDCVKEFKDKTEIYTHNIRSGYYNKQQLMYEYYQHLLMMPSVEYPPTISNWLCVFSNRLNDKQYLRYKEGVRYSEDLLFGALLMRKAESFYYMKGKTFYHYCMNSQSVSHTFVPDKWTDYCLLYHEIKKIFWDDSEYDFRKQIDYCLLFFVYNTVGEIMSVNDLSLDEKYKKSIEILKNKEVRQMFSRIHILKLSISWKQRIITWIYKHYWGLKILIKYYM